MEKHRTGIKPGLLTIKLLLGNLLLVFIPWLAIFSLDTYESQLLINLEKTMVQQGRVTAAALSSIEPQEAGTSRDWEVLRLELRSRAMELLRHLRGRHESRLRIVDNQGNLLADSAVVSTPSTNPREEPPSPSSRLDSGQQEELQEDPSQSWLYQLGSWPIRMYRRIFEEPREYPSEDPYPPGTLVLGPEVQSALAGRYGAITRITPGGESSVTLYSAIPIILDSGEVIGAVLVNQSTYRILVDLYDLRLDILQLSLFSFLAAFLITVYLEISIARPLMKLAFHSRRLISRTGGLKDFPTPSDRKDEVGELGRALWEMTREIQGRIQRTESFSSDVAHELKNPLASLQAAAELGLDGGFPKEAQRLFSRIEADSQRLGRLIDDIRELSRIDGIDPSRLHGSGTDSAQIQSLISEWSSNQGRPVEFQAKENLRIPLAQGYFQRILWNLLGNAHSLSPQGTPIHIEMAQEENQLVFQVRDHGSGFDPDSLDRVFQRFYTYRPTGGSRHSGLGLAMVKTLCDLSGGIPRAFNHPQGGAVVRLSWGISALPNQFTSSTRTSRRSNSGTERGKSP